MWTYKVCWRFKSWKANPLNMRRSSMYSSLVPSFTVPRSAILACKWSNYQVWILHKSSCIISCKAFPGFPVSWSWPWLWVQGPFILLLFWLLELDFQCFIICWTIWNFSALTIHSSHPQKAQITWNNFATVPQVFYKCVAN